VCIIVALSEIKHYDLCISPIDKGMQEKQVKITSARAKIKHSLGVQTKGM
jgi:hypothetical protein